MFDPISKSMRSVACIAALAAAGALSLSACTEKSGNQTVGQKVDSAISATKEAASDAKEKTEQMASDAKAKAEASSASAGSEMKDAGGKLASTVDDATITAAVSEGLAKDPDLSAVKIDVDTKGGAVSLMGPAPTSAAKARAEEIAKNVKGVNAVDNQLEVKSM